MKKLLVMVGIAISLAGCSNGGFVRGTWYSKLCTNVFVDDENKAGVWNSSANGSCTGGPFQTAYYAVKGAL